MSPIAQLLAACPTGYQSTLSVAAGVTRAGHGRAAAQLSKQTCQCQLRRRCASVTREGSRRGLDRSSLYRTRGRNAGGAPADARSLPWAGCTLADRWISAIWVASWRRISCRRRPLNRSRYLGLPTWIRWNRRECYVPGPVRQLKLYIRDSERIRGGPSAHVHTLVPQHQRYHEEPHKPMDRGDCQGSLHSSWSSLRPCDSAWGPSAFSFIRVTLSGGFTWHLVSGVLEVIWGLPEFVPARHGLYRWGHVNTGSSGGCTTRSGSRASSPTSIAYTICMQPLLRRS